MREIEREKMSSFENWGDGSHVLHVYTVCLEMPSFHRFCRDEVGTAS